MNAWYKRITVRLKKVIKDAERESEQNRVVQISTFGGGASVDKKHIAEKLKDDRLIILNQFRKKTD